MFSRKGLVVTVAGILATTCISTAAQARDGWYFGGAVGPNFKDSETFTNNGSFDAGFSDSIAYGINAGYAMPNGLRPEFAIDFRSNDVNSLSANGNSTSNTTGHEDANSFMGNLWYDIKLPQRQLRQLHPYVGGGLGFATVGVHGLSLSSLSPYASIDDDQTVFAYQIGVGAAYDIAPNWQLTGDFRYLATDKADFKYSAPAPIPGGTFSAGYSAESLMFGVRYQFGPRVFR